MRNILFATGNPNKVREVQMVLKDNFSIITPQDIGLFIDVPETGETLKENALIKTKAYDLTYKGHVFSEDTGLEVTALKGAPGVHTARYAGPAADATQNMQKLLKALEKNKDRTAQFRTVICLKFQNNIYYFEGICKGRISNKIEGEKGFGYDPLFIPDGYQKTFAELGDDIKKKLSHRSIAMSKMIDFLLNEKN